MASGEQQPKALYVWGSLLLSLITGGGMPRLVSVAQAGVPDVATARRVRVSREGVVELRLPPGSAGPYEVSASAFSERGARSPVVRERLR